MSKTLRRWLIPLVFVLLVCTTGAFTACGGKDNPDPDPGTEATTYTIVFDSNGGGSVSDKTWTEGTTLALPTPSAGSSIEMYGYTFVGWFYDEDCTKAVDRTDFDVSYANEGVITLYAGWTNLHNIYFDTKTSVAVGPVQYAYGSMVSVADLPQPAPRIVGSTVCKFVYWIQTNTGNPVTEDFVMDAQDMYFYAYYDIGTNVRFELDDDGYYNPTGTNTTTTQSRYYDYTLQDGQVYSVDMTLPADWSTYSDDCGPVFTGTHFDDAGTTFNNGHYVVMFVSCQKNFNGAIEFWGTADVNGTPTDLKLIARYALDGNVLKDTPYYEKMTAYQASGEEETFTFTYRRVDNQNGSITWYVGIDGVEYIRLTTGQQPYPEADAGNLIVSASLAAADDDGNIGSLVGLRAKTLNVKYSEISVSEYNGVEIIFDAGNGTIAGKSALSFEYGTPITLPVPSYPGYEFVGWYYYTDYATGESEMLEDSTVFDSSVWKIFVIARWRKEGAKPFTVQFETGAEGYSLDALTGWYEGNRLTAPSLDYYLDSSYLYLYTGDWYYDAALTVKADLSNIDTTKATVTDADTDNQSFTLYAGYLRRNVLEGNGTEEDPYLIANETDLLTMGKMVELGRSFENSYLKLTADIALTQAWTPVGSASKPFSGIFDGNGKKITGLIVESEFGYQAMFAYTYNASIRNLELTVDITGGNLYVGGFIAYSAGTTLVENCVLYGTVTGLTSVGGFIGSCYNSTTVRNCVNFASINGTSNVNASVVGGLVGGTTNVVTIENCENYGTVSSNGGMVGGVVGILRADANAIVTGCVNYGTVSGLSAIGGIAGVSRGRIQYSFCSASALIGGTAASELSEIGYSTSAVSTGPNGYIIGQRDNKAAPATAVDPISCGLCDEEGKISYTLDYGYEVDGTEYTVTGSAKVGEILPEPERTGYRFGGWYVDGEAYNAVYTNATYTANWIGQITVTFSSGENETITGDTVYTIDVNTALGTIPAVEKTVGDLQYTFDGWYLSDGTKVTTETVFSESATVTAVWIDKITVTFDTDEGTFTDSGEQGTRTIDKGSTIGTLPEVEKAGYNFLGWYLSDGITQVKADSIFDATAIVKAKWEYKTQYVTVSFDVNGGLFTEESETGNRSVESGTAIGTLPAVKRSGYTFKGWFYTDNSGIQVQATSETVVSGTVELTAVWLEIYTVTFNAGSGSVDEESRLVTDGEAVGTLPGAIRDGYCLDGWTCNGNSVDQDTVITGNAEFIAVWSVDHLLGSGTETSPYRISNAEELTFFATSVKNGETTYNASGVYVTVMADIDMTGVAFTPIGNSASPWIGIFDGNGHVISNLNISGTSYVGFFGRLSNATVKNLEIRIAIVATGGAVGGIAGQVSGGTFIENCIVRGSIQTNASDVGGIAGNSKSGDAAQVTISNCVNYATVNCTITGTACTGGILGACEATYGTVISGCVNYGAVSSGGNFAGGIIGLLRKNVASKVTGCYNYGNVTASVSATGGIVGCARATVENCYCYSEALINQSLASTLNADGYLTSVGGSGSGYIIGQVNDGASGGSPSDNCGLCDENGDPYSAES